MRSRLLVLSFGCCGLWSAIGCGGSNNDFFHGGGARSGGSGALGGGGTAGSTVAPLGGTSGSGGSSGSGESGSAAAARGGNAGSNVNGSAGEAGADAGGHGGAPVSSSGGAKAGGQGGATGTGGGGGGGDDGAGTAGSESDGGARSSDAGEGGRTNGEGGASIGGAGGDATSSGAGEAGSLAGGRNGEGGTPTDAGAPGAGGAEAVGGQENGGEGGRLDPCANAERCDGADNDCNDGADEGGVCPDSCRGFELEGHAYMFCTNAGGHFARAEICEDVGMELVRIDSASENAGVLAAVQRLGANAPPGSIHVGATDYGPGNEGNFRWPGGTVFWIGTESGSAVNGAYVNWDTGEPNDYESNEDCVEMLVAALAEKAGLWNDVRCSTALSFVCEE